MRLIKASEVTKIVSQLCLEANFNLREDVLSSLKNAYKKETNLRAKKILKAIIDNAGIAKKEKLPLCQDTGMAIVFVELGQDVHIVGGDFITAINKGIEGGYKKGFLRNSIITDPLFRGKSKYSPSVIHIDLVKGNKIKLTVLPKGFGCENKSQVKMFNPTDSIKEIKDFIIKVVKDAGPNACPPYVVGVGIGGTQDYACLLAKKALLRKLNTQHSKLEKDLLTAINNLNIGPMGLGGGTTCLGVNIETYPTHIAGLPVAVNISCHALRSATKEI